MRGWTGGRLDQMSGIWVQSGNRFWVAERSSGVFEGARDCPASDMHSSAHPMLVWSS